MNEYCYADYAIGSVNKRNNIQNINYFKLNGIKNDCYRSLFLFDESLKLYVDRTGSISGYAGKHISDALVFDFDGEDLEAVRDETYKFVMYLYHTFDIPFEYLRIAFSGSKGFHITIPISAICEDPQPKEDFYKIYKGIAEDLAGEFKFVDFSIYESKRLFRLTNTINSKSGLYKIPLVYDELEMSIDEIKELAKKPRKIEQLPISEIQVVKPLNDLYEKWSSYDFDYKVETKKDDFLDIMRGGLSEGGRHTAAIRIVGALQSRGMDYEYILELLKHWNQSNDPPLPLGRLEAESRRAFNDNHKRITIDKKEILSLKDAAKIYDDYVHKINECKVKTGFGKIDDRIRGIMPGETMCVLGKTSVGKSAFLQNIAHNYAKQSGEPVLFFSLEMPTTSVFERTMQIETGYSGYNIENLTRENDLELQTRANLVFSELSNFYIITKSGLNLDEIKQFISLGEQHIYKRKTGLVLIDYLSLVKGKGKDLYEQVSRVARGMKDLAKETNIPIIYLSQVTKQFTEYDELQINSARDSGSIDEASDFVLALWKQKDKRSDSEQTDIPLNLAILKNRKGSLGKIKIVMDKRSLKIYERI